MNQKELNKIFMMISNWQKPFGLHGLHKILSALMFKQELYALICIDCSMHEPIKRQVFQFKFLPTWGCASKITHICLI